MVPAGNKKMPLKSLIISNLGSSYCGVTAEELQAELDIYEVEETKGEVDPVCDDRNSRHDLLLNALGNKHKNIIPINTSIN